MSGYVLKRTSDGMFVTPRGSEHSYCKGLQNARVFPTHGAADAERCVENETVVPVEELLQRE